MSSISYIKNEASKGRINGSRSMQIEYIKKERERNHRLGKVATHESMPYFH